MRAASLSVCWSPSMTASGRLAQCADTSSPAEWSCQNPDSTPDSARRCRARQIARDSLRHSRHSSTGCPARSAACALAQAGRMRVRRRGFVAVAAAACASAVWTSRRVAGLVTCCAACPPHAAARDRLTRPRIVTSPDSHPHVLHITRSPHALPVAPHSPSICRTRICVPPVTRNRYPPQRAQASPSAASGTAAPHSSHQAVPAAARSPGARRRRRCRGPPLRSKSAWPQARRSKLPDLDPQRANAPNPPRRAAACAICSTSSASAISCTARFLSIAIGAARMLRRARSALSIAKLRRRRARHLILVKGSRAGRTGKGGRLQNVAAAEVAQRAARSRKPHLRRFPGKLRQPAKRVTKPSASKGGPLKSACMKSQPNSASFAAAASSATATAMTSSLTGAPVR